MKPKVFPLWLLLLCFALPSGAGAADGTETPVGKIELARGAVTILRADGREARGEQGLGLFPGDQISTGKAAEVRFNLPPGRQFRLAAEAQVSIDELSSSEGDEDPPVMRLVMGYLWSKIEKITRKTDGFEIYTPTAVLGVRGTEFETVVSLDAASVVAVDEGKVSVEADETAVLLEPGKMTEIGFEGKPSHPSPTVSKEVRDWQAWREKRVQGFTRKLPRMAPRLRHRFEQGAVRAGKFADTVRERGDGIRETMQKVREAKQQRDKPRIRESVERLREQTEEFKRMAARFRQALNRFRVMGRLSIRWEQFVKENSGRFPERQSAFLQAQFAAIAEKREEVKEAHVKAISAIREVFRDRKAFREEMITQKGAAESS